MSYSLFLLCISILSSSLQVNSQIFPNNLNEQKESKIKSRSSFLKKETKSHAQHYRFSNNYNNTGECNFTHVNAPTQQQDKINATNYTRTIIPLPVSNKN